MIQLLRLIFAQGPALRAWQCMQGRNISPEATADRSSEAMGTVWVVIEDSTTLPFYVPYLEGSTSGSKDPVKMIILRRNEVAVCVRLHAKEVA